MASTSFQPQNPQILYTSNQGRRESARLVPLIEGIDELLFGQAADGALHAVGLADELPLILKP